MGQVHLIQHAEKEGQAGDPGLTLAGVEQAERVAEYLAGLAVRDVYSSPLQRAIETAQIIADRLGLVVVPDSRLVERVNWDATISYEQFVEEWEKSVEDRDYQPENGFTSRQAGDRLLEFVEEMETQGQGAVVAVTHGGITVDLLRTLLGDGRVPRALWDAGVPPTAITTLEGREVLSGPAVRGD